MSMLKQTSPPFGTASSNAQTEGIQHLPDYLLLKNLSNSQQLNSDTCATSYEKSSNAEKQLPSLITSDLISDIASTHGYQKPLKFDYESFDNIARLVEFRLLQVIQEAKKFVHNSFRPSNQEVLTTKDIKNALQVLKMQPILGYSHNWQYQFVGINSPNANEKIFKRELIKTDKDKNVQEGQHGKLRLLGIIYKDFLSSVPCEPSLSLHWLAIYGKTPKSSLNLIVDQFDESHDTHTLSKAYMEFSGRNQKSLQNYTQNNDLKQHENMPDNDMALHIHQFSYLQPYNTSITGLGSNKNSLRLDAFTLAHRIPHILGVEHQYFLEEIKNSILSMIYRKGHEDLSRYHKGLDILSSSPGLDQLIPFLLQFFALEIEHLYESSMLFGVSIMLRFVEALIHNPHIKLHNYIHQIIAPLLNIILKSDYKLPLITYYGFHLRREAASVLGELTRIMRYSKGIMDQLDFILLQIYKKHILNPDSSLLSCFGAIEGVRSLGIQAMQFLLIPILPHIFKLILSIKSISIFEMETLPLHKKDTEQNKFVTLKCFLLSQLEASLLNCIYDIILAQFSENEFSCRDSFIQQATSAILWDTFDCISTHLDDHTIPIFVAALHKCNRQKSNDNLKTRDENSYKMNSYKQDNYTQNDYIEFFSSCI